MRVRTATAFLLYVAVFSWAFFAGSKIVMLGSIVLFVLVEAYLIEKEK